MNSGWLAGSQHMEPQSRLQSDGDIFDTSHISRLIKPEISLEGIWGSCEGFHVQCTCACLCVCVYSGCMSGGCAESETETEKTFTALTLRDLPLVGERLANMTSWTSHLPFTWLKSSVVTSSQRHLSPHLLKQGYQNDAQTMITCTLCL